MAKKIEIVPGLVHLDQLVPENLLAPGYYPMHIKSKKAEKELVILGTRLVIDGKSYLLSKSSMVGENPTVDVSGKAIELQVLSRDVSKDLVLLMLPANENWGIAMEQLKIDQIHHEDIGSFLVSPTPDKLKVSVVSSVIFNQPRKFSAGFMGMSVIFKDGKTQISRLAPGSPAAASTLKVGDEVLSVNGISIDGPEQYSLELVKSSPGDTINFEGQGEAGRYNTSIILSAWPVRDHSADQFDGGRSVRCDGFSRVFAHDSIITAEQCGGSVFDLSDKFRGINIARFSRTVTLVMPAEEIYAFLSQALNKKIQVVQ
ncbi:PDZ domain (Also known as DHR or GLGF) [compost metagenome]